MSGNNELFTNTMLGLAGTLIVSCSVAFCCRLRRQLRGPPEGTPLPPRSQQSIDTVVQVQPTAPPAPPVISNNPVIYYPNSQQRYTVYMPPPSQFYYPQTQPPAFQPYQPTYTTNPYPPR
jgi:hypothetical protein